jgi:hypothetical protein
MLPARPRYHSFPKVSWSVSGHSRRGPQRVMDANEKVVSQFDCGDRFVDPVRKRHCPNRITVLSFPNFASRYQLVAALID